MNKRKIYNTFTLAGLAILFLLLFAITKSAYGSEYYNVTKAFDVYWFDVNKPKFNSSNDNTCTSAAMANAITSATGRNDHKSAYALYDFFKSKLGNKAMSPKEVWETLTDEPDDCYLKYYPFDSVFLFPGDPAFNMIRGALLSANIVMIGLENAKGEKHIVTVWGYKIQDDGKCYLYITDSDDGETDIFPVRVTSHRKTKEHYIQFPEGDFWKIEAYYSIKIVRGE